MFLGCFFYIGYDIVFLEVCNFFIFKLDVLMEHAKLIGSKDIPKAKQHELLKKVCTMHSDILTFLDTCNSFYSVNICVTYIAQTAILCTLLVAVQLVRYSQYSLHHSQVTSRNSAYQFQTPSTNLSLFFPCCLGNLFILSYFGDSVESKHNNFSETLYSSTWYNLECTSDRRMFQFILANSKRVVGMKLIGGFLLSFQAFSEVGWYKDDNLFLILIAKFARLSKSHTALLLS